MNEELNDRELEQLERELRSLGDPYGSPEPDLRYFANFRARVMERIAEETEGVGFGSRIRDFFLGSTLRMTLMGGTLVAALALYFFLQSGQSEAPVAMQPHESVAPIAPQASVTEKAPEMAAPEVRPSVENAPRVVTHHVTTAPQHVQPEVAQQQPATPEQSAMTQGQRSIADAASDFDKMDELSISDDNEPVSYDRLSAEELEAVLKTLESEPLTIQ